MVSAKQKGAHHPDFGARSGRGAVSHFSQLSRVVPETRLELVSPFGRRILSPLRIPFRHSGSEQLDGIVRFQCRVGARKMGV